MRFVWKSKRALVFNYVMMSLQVFALFKFLFELFLHGFIQETKITIQFETDNT